MLEGLYLGGQKQTKNVVQIQKKLVYQILPRRKQLQVISVHFFSLLEYGNWTWWHQDSQGYDCYTDCCKNLHQLRNWWWPNQWDHKKWQRIMEGLVANPLLSRWTFQAGKYWHSDSKPANQLCRSCHLWWPESVVFRLRCSVSWQFWIFLLTPGLLTAFGKWQSSQLGKMTH